jgi:hypothetical protein
MYRVSGSIRGSAGSHGRPDVTIQGFYQGGLRPKKLIQHKVVLLEGDSFILGIKK